MTSRRKPQICEGHIWLWWVKLFSVCFYWTLKIRFKTKQIHIPICLTLFPLYSKSKIVPESVQKISNFHPYQTLIIVCYQGKVRKAIFSHQRWAKCSKEMSLLTWYTICWSPQEFSYNRSWEKKDPILALKNVINFTFLKAISLTCGRGREFPFLQLSLFWAQNILYFHESVF